jgi:hypothetical protein
MHMGGADPLGAFVAEANPLHRKIFFYAGLRAALLTYAIWQAWWIES